MTTHADGPTSSPAGLAALREHRRMRAVSYQSGDIPLWAPAVGVLAVGVVFTAIHFFFVRSIVQTVLVGGLFVVIALGVGLYMHRMGSTSPADQHRLELLSKELPAFLAAASHAANATPERVSTLTPTLRFLEAYGIGAVPQACLRRLGLRGLVRHRLEGSWYGRPVAVEVVLGRVALAAYDPDPANHGVAVPVGPHLFVFLAGECEQPPPAALHGFQVTPTMGGVVLQHRLLDGLPSVDALVDAIRRLGPSRAWAPFPPADPGAAIAYASAQEAGDAFLGALRDRDYGRALLATHPWLAYRQELELTPASLEDFVRRVQLYPVQWTWPSVLNRKNLDECWGDLRVRVPAGEIPVPLQLYHDAGSWRVRYCAVGSHELGYCSPAVRYQSL